MRVVIDTSVWIAALIEDDPLAVGVVSAAASGRFCWLASDACLKELVLVYWRHLCEFLGRLPPDLDKRLRFLSNCVEAFTIFLEALAKRTPVEVMVSGRGPYVIADPSDDKFIICAIDGNADYIVTMDGTHLLDYFRGLKEPLRNSAGTEIRALSPFQFVNYPLRGKSPRV